MWIQSCFRMLKFPVVALVLSWSASAYAERIRCNEHQSECFVNDKSWALGDSIGVFNRDNELIAVGKVDKIEGSERTIDIDRKFGTIKRSDRFALLESDSMDNLTKDFSVYKRPASIAAGASIGLAKIGIGDGANGLLIDAFGQYGWKRKFELVGRASFLSVSGEANGDIYAPFPNGKFSMLGFGVSPGIAYHYNKNRTLSARAELGLGLMYANAEIENDERLLKRFVTNVESGFGMLGRADASVFYRIGEWQPGIGFSYIRIQDSQGFDVGMRISRDIR